MLDKNKKILICDKLMTTENSTDSNLNNLKTARENSGMTLKDLFERTRISVVNLDAIENSDFHLLPVPIYTRNFIKTYADALGVDSEPVLQRYENYLQTLQMKQKAQIAEQPPRSPLAAMLGQYKAYIWIAGIIIVFVAVSFFVSLYNKPATEAHLNTEAAKEAISPEIKSQSPEQAKSLPLSADLQKPEAPIVTDKPTPDSKKPAPALPEAKPSNAATTVAAPKNNDDKLKALIDDEESSVLVVQATEETWIRIKADEKEPFQVLLKPGEKVSHKGARFNMDIGNAGGIRIKFNGKNFDNLGKSGQVIHLRIP